MYCCLCFRKHTGPHSPGGVAVVQALGPMNNAVFTPHQQSNPIYDTDQIQLNINNTPENKESVTLNNTVTSIESHTSTPYGLNSSTMCILRSCDNTLLNQQYVENDYSTIAELMLGESKIERRLPDLPADNTCDDLNDED